MTLHYIDLLIALQWAKNPKNASEAHFRAQELTRLQKLKEERIKKSNHGK